MPKTITFSLSHELTQDEVKRRIVTAIADARSKFPDLLKDVHERWTENQMDFYARAMGQAITSRIVIEPNVVHVSIDLPLVFAMLAGNLKPRIEKEGQKLLEQKT